MPLQLCGSGIIPSRELNQVAQRLAFKAFEDTNRALESACWILHQHTKVCFGHENVPKTRFGPVLGRYGSLESKINKRLNFNSF